MGVKKAEGKNENVLTILININNLKMKCLPRKVNNIYRNSKNNTQTIVVKFESCIKKKKQEFNSRRYFRRTSIFTNEDLVEKTYTFNMKAIKILEREVNKSVERTVRPFKTMLFFTFVIFNCKTTNL